MRYDAARMASTRLRESLPLPPSLPRSATRDFGPFRPLRPFREDERSFFFGRDSEVAALAALLSSERQTVLLYGESGVGKSSLVSAGLIPQLKARGVACAVIDGNDLIEELPSAQAASALLVIDDLGAALDGGPRFDRLLGFLREAASRKNVKVLFVIDDNDLHRLDGLEREVGLLATVGSRLRLERFDEARVAEIVERTILGGGAYFEAGLSQQERARPGALRAGLSLRAAESSPPLRWRPV